MPLESRVKRDIQRRKILNVTVSSWFFVKNAESTWKCIIGKHIMETPRTLETFERHLGAYDIGITRSYMCVCIYIYCNRHACVYIHLQARRDLHTHVHACEYILFHDISRSQKAPYETRLGVGMYVPRFVISHSRHHSRTPEIVVFVLQADWDFSLAAKLKRDRWCAHTAAGHCAPVAHKYREVSPFHHGRINIFPAERSAYVAREGLVPRRDSRIILASLKRHETFFLPGDIFPVFMFRDGYVRLYVST